MSGRACGLSCIRLGTFVPERRSSRQASDHVGSRGTDTWRRAALWTSSARASRHPCAKMPHLTGALCYCRSSARTQKLRRGADTRTVRPREGSVLASVPSPGCRAGAFHLSGDENLTLDSHVRDGWARFTAAERVRCRSVRFGGFDHGVFAPFLIVDPEAQIPAPRAYHAREATASAADGRRRRRGRGGGRAQLR